MALIARSAEPQASALPDKIAVILHEARWLALVGLALFLALALGGFSPADPGWSHAVHVELVANPAGRFGAWLADLMFYVFGYSAWWWVVLMLLVVWWGYRRLDRLKRDPQSRRPLAVALAGFVVLLVASSAIESLRFHSYGGQLPLAAGGMLGIEAGRATLDYFGFTGGTLLLLLSLALGWTLFSGISWLRAAERLGSVLEAAYLALRGVYERWQDRRIGKAVAARREAVVEVEKKRIEQKEPVIIARPEPPPEPSKKVEKRKERERQPALFPEAVAGGLLPPLHLLDAAAKTTDLPTTELLEFTSRLIERKLADFGVQVQVTAAFPGPVVTRFEIEPATGVKGNTVVNLAKDLARSLSVESVRVVETVPGKSCMALELPNAKRQMVRLSEILSAKVYHDMSSPLTVALGKDIGGQPFVADLGKMPHLLVAGATGMGKSVGLNAMLLSLLFKTEPEQLRLILVDPKMVELSIYADIPHLLTPVVTDMRQAANALNWCVGEMEKRYKLMSALGVRNIAGLNGKIKDAEKRGEKLFNPLSLTPEAPEPLEPMPYIVVVIDELADLMMVVGKKIEELIARLAQKARAAGVHLILATQRPSVDVITGLIKANIPTRIGFRVSSKIDSRTVLDQGGAEMLLGQGDMLYLAPGSSLPARVHGAFVADDEVHRVVDYLKAAGKPNYLADVLVGAVEDGEGGGGGEDGGEGGDAESDPLYDQAVEVVLKNRRASISLVQRHLRIGYNRSARLIEAMEKSGLVSAMDTRGGREVLAPARSEE